MSLRAIVWAFDQEIRPSSLKLLLLAVADYANDDNRELWPTVETLTHKTSQDRKTVIKGLDELEERGYLTDTGKRRGKTSSVKVYEWMQPSSPKNGTPKQSRFSVEAVPFFPGSSTVFPGKQYQKRYSEPVIEPVMEPVKEPQMSDAAAPDHIAVVFRHWKIEHKHPNAKLDGKRRKVIATALKSYTPDELCQSITGYLNSPHHMGQNDRATVYDDIEIFLRDAKHIDAGLKFHVDPPSTHSKLTRKNIAATSGWLPPEMRNAS